LSVHNGAPSSNQDGLHRITSDSKESRSRRTDTYALAGFRDGLNQALDRIGFTGAYVETEVARLRGRGEGDEDIERQLGSD
jgi:hypothetical protein